MTMANTQQQPEVAGGLTDEQRLSYALRLGDVAMQRAVEVDNLRWEKFELLSAGFVTLVDVMGSDAAIVQAARVSYGDGTKKTSADDALIRYLFRHRHCYDAETEVLTDVGFVSWPEVYQDARGGEGVTPKFGIWDEASSSLVYEEPEYLTCDPFEGEMYRVDHGGVDLLVTPEHTMWVKRKMWQDDQMVWGDSFGLSSAAELGNSSTVRYSKLAPFRGPVDFDGSLIALTFDDPRELLRLMAFFIGDGSIDKTAANGLAFNLKKQRKRDFLREVCDGLGWEFRELSGHHISVRADRVSEVFRTLFYNPDGDKQIPLFMHHLNCDDSQSLLEGFRASDGTEKRAAWSYSTSVAAVAEQLQIIALHAGEAAHFYPKGDVGMWEVMFLSRMREPIINQSGLNTSMQSYKGKVYCAKTRTGVLVVRRHGKIVLSGNTTPFEMAEIKLLVKVPMDLWRQWIRHRTANVNEYSTRYSVAIDECDETDPQAWRLQSGANKQGSEGLVTKWPEGYIVEEVTDGYVVKHPDRDDFSCHDATTPGAYLTAREQAVQNTSRELYEERVEKFDVAREQARKDLPLSTYTLAYWKNDLHNLLHFLGLRMDPHAQLEIRQFATTIGEQIVAPLFPAVWDAFQKYRMKATFVSGPMKEIIAAIVKLGYKPPYSNLEFVVAAESVFPNWFPRDDERNLKPHREREEVRDTFVSLGLLRTA